MKNRIKLISLATYLFLSLSLTGCWSSVELNKLGIVVGVALDKKEKSDDITVTTQIGVPSLEKSNTGIGASKQYVNIKEKGKTVSEALKNISREYNRLLFFAHNQVVIINKELAYQGISSEIDFFLRNRETRPLTWIMVSNGEATDILDMNPSSRDDPGISIGKLIKNEENVSQLPIVNFKDFTMKLMSKTTSPVVPIVDLKPIDNNQKIPYIAKTAVFKKEKMVGELNESESMGLLWATNKVKYGTMLVNSPSGNEKVGIKITRAKGKIRPEVKDGIIYMNINIKAEGDILEQTTSEDLANPKSFKAIEEIENTYIENQVMEAWDKAKELNADIFGFGDNLYKFKTKEWKKVENKWEEEFPKVAVKVVVDTKVRRMGKITKPATFQGK
ncbi:Ger(x)C family spore germination protein [Clostridium sp. C8-1-8]|uniref:Ger(x)C family spore germination protein n=1 Tax=Clostridium sp. C8-1-8 TaxID=2698831 RepID=UPI00136D02F9|nr:Ger(x)C family spore germination protein [Clostridium sp. C8-1-8]